jgi:hypothetical protein
MQLSDLGDDVASLCEAVSVLDIRIALAMATTEARQPGPG